MQRVARWAWRRCSHLAKPPARAHRHLRNSGALLGSALLLSAMAVGARADTCRDRNFVDGLSLEMRATDSVRAISSNGKTYDGIESATFQAAIGIDLCHPGALNGMILHLGACTGHRGVCNSMPVMFQEYPHARSLHTARTFSFTIPAGSDAGRRLVDACNDNKGDVSSVFPFGMNVDVTLGVGTQRDLGQLNRWGGPGLELGEEGEGDTDPYTRPLADYSKTKSFRPSLSVACAPLAEEIKVPQPVSVNVSVEPKGDVCPKETDVTAWIYYDQPVEAKFRFKIDGKLSGLYTRRAVALGHDGPAPPRGTDRKHGKYLVKETKTYRLDPGQHHFRVEVRGGAKSEVVTRRIECPPFKVTSAWLDYDVEDKLTCPKHVGETATFRSTRPGKAPFQIKTQGGLVVHSGTAVFARKGKAYVASVNRDLVLNAFDQDMMALITNQPDANSGWTRLKVDCMQVLSGTLDLREFAATRCEGEAAFSIRTSMPGEVPYQLDCTGGRSWSGTAQSQKTGADTYLAVDTKRFMVSNNEHVNCALKTRAPLPVKVLALKGNKYECHRPSGVSGSNDLAPETRPDPAGPRPDRAVLDPPRVPSDPPGPGLVGDPGRRISCSGGTVRNGRCLCPRTHMAVQAGSTAWRCVRSAIVDPPRRSGPGKAGSSAVGSGPKRQNAQADRRRLEAIKKSQSSNRKRRPGKNAAR